MRQPKNLPLQYRLNLPLPPLPRHPPKSVIQLPRIQSEKEVWQQPLADLESSGQP